jgi:HK97 family phage major capsid protein
MLTPEQMEQQLKQTADAIEKGLKDIKENKATKKEVLDLIKNEKQKDVEMLNAHQTSIAEINTGLADVAKSCKELQKQVLNFRSFRTSSLFEGGKYKGHFSSPAEAKAFACLVLVACTAGTKVEAKYDWAKKHLDSLGIEPYFVTEQGFKAMTGSAQTGGGALVMAEQIPSIIMLLEQYGLFRRDAQVMPMGGGTTTVPKIDGLLTIYCPGEGGTITSTDPSISVINLVPKTLYGLTVFSSELEEDSMVALGELLAGLFARSFAYYEDLCGFLGDGTGTYFGFKGIVAALRAVSATIASIKSLVVGAGNAYSELTLANFESVAGILPQYADDGDAGWYVHRYFFFTVMVTLALTANAGTATEVLAGTSLRTRTYLGYPVNFTQVMPKAEGNSQICALLANLRQGAILGTRGGIEFAQSSDVYFNKGQIAVRGRDRVAINIHGVGDTTNAGPICGLITAAS